MTRRAAPRPSPFASVRAVLFDLGGTLDAPGTDWNTRFFRLFRRAGAKVSFARFTAVSDKALAAFAVRPEAHGWHLAPAILHNVEAMGAALPFGKKAQHRRIARAMVADLVRNARKARPVLERLRRRGYRIGLITNNVGNTIPVLKDEGILSCFDTVLDSTLEGIRKPDPEIFRRALRRLSLPASQAAYVGDKFEIDVRGSKAVGMSAVWITGKVRRRCPDPKLPDAVVRLLPEILSLFPGAPGAYNAGSKR